MERSEITKTFFEKNREMLKPFLKKERESYSNPALKVHETIEERPYSKEDFVRKEFHMNLVKRD